MRTALTCLLGALLSAPLVADESPLERIAARLTGAFSNAAQARADSNFREVVLHCARIWPARTDGHWLYLEQAMAIAPNMPYRQQVFLLASAPDGAVEARVFNLANPIVLTGAWKDPQRFASLTPADLVARPGCTIRFKVAADGSATGATEGTGCPSELENADHATTELTVAAEGIGIWDRGFDAAGHQVWGPPFRGFEFRRVE